MNRMELVSAIAEKAGMTKKDSEAALSATIEAITNTLKKGEKVQLVGFGTFETRQRAAREGRNPQTGAKIKIDATTSPVFRAGKALKDAIK
ncbi:MAG: HU family DNA-binding protein [Firmicutes bacterium]|nr:HU family DNA-binding protein [Bacillota bacterium]